MPNPNAANGSTGCGPVGHPEAITVTIAGAMSLTGWSRTECYRLLGLNKISAVKGGPKGQTTLVLVASIRAHLASLPPARFKRATTANQ